MDKQDNPVLRNLIKAIIRLSRSTDSGEINNLYVISCDLLADLATCSLCDAAKVIAERMKKGSDRDTIEEFRHLMATIDIAYLLYKKRGDKDAKEDQDSRQGIKQAT